MIRYICFVSVAVTDGNYLIRDLLGGSNKTRKCWLTDRGCRDSNNLCSNLSDMVFIDTEASCLNIKEEEQ